MYGATLLAPRRSRDIAWLRERLLEVIGPANVAALWIPRSVDALTNTTAPDANAWTHANTQVGRYTANGEGGFVTFNGTTDNATHTDTGLPGTTAARTLLALVNPTAINVADNPIFGYGTATAKHGILWELNNARQRVGVFTANSDLATSSQVVGTPALLGVDLAGGDTFHFWQNGAADGTSVAIAGISTTLVGAGGALIADPAQPATWGLANKGNLSTAFVCVASVVLTAAQHAALAEACRRVYGVRL